MNLKIEYSLFSRGIEPGVLPTCRATTGSSLGTLDVNLKADDLAHIKQAVPAEAMAGDRYNEQVMAMLESELGVALPERCTLGHYGGQLFEQIDESQTWQAVRLLLPGDRPTTLVRSASARRTRVSFERTNFFFAFNIPLPPPA